jgi:hypothetical protein
LRALRKKPFFAPCVSMNLSGWPAPGGVKVAAEADRQQVPRAGSPGKFF